MDNDIAYEKLKEWVKVKGSLSTGPSFAFGYEADFSHMSSNGVDIKMTRNEKPSSSMLILTDIHNVLSTYYEEQDGIDRKDIRFAISFLSSGDIQSFNRGGAIIAVSGGIAPSYLEKDNNDIVDAMHLVDDLGFEVLRAGVRHGYHPICAKADYNFCNITRIAENSEGLAELIKKID